MMMAHFHQSMINVNKLTLFSVIRALSEPNRTPAAAARNAEIFVVG